MADTETKTSDTHIIGDIVEGVVIAVDRSVVYIDLSPIGTGIIYGREFAVAKDILRKTKVGDTISAPNHRKQKHRKDTLISH